jgi:hypothetical protein
MSTSGLARHLLREGLLSHDDCQMIAKDHSSTGAGFAKVIVVLGLMTDEKLAQYIAKKTRYELIPPGSLCITQNGAEGTIDIPLMQRLEVVPISLTRNTLRVAMADPLDGITVNQLEFFLPYNIKPIIASFTSLNKTLTQLIQDYEPNRGSLEKFLSGHGVKRKPQAAAKPPRPAPVEEAPPPEEPELPTLQNALMDESSVDEVSEQEPVIEAAPAPKPAPAPAPPAKPMPPKNPQMAALTEDEDEDIGGIWPDDDEGPPLKRARASANPDPEPVAAAPESVAVESDVALWPDEKPPEEAVAAREAPKPEADELPPEDLELAADTTEPEAKPKVQHSEAELQMPPELRSNPIDPSDPDSFEGFSMDDDAGAAGAMQSELGPATNNEASMASEQFSTQVDGAADASDVLAEDQAGEAFAGAMIEDPLRAEADLQGDEISLDDVADSADESESGEATTIELAAEDSDDLPDLESLGEDNSERSLLAERSLLGANDESPENNLGDDLDASLLDENEAEEEALSAAAPDDSSMDDFAAAVDMPDLAEDEALLGVKSDAKNENGDDFSAVEDPLLGEEDAMLAANDTSPGEAMESPSGHEAGDDFAMELDATEEPAIDLGATAADDFDEPALDIGASIAEKPARSSEQRLVTPESAIASLNLGLVRTNMSFDKEKARKAAIDALQQAGLRQGAVFANSQPDALLLQWGTKAPKSRPSLEGASSDGDTKWQALDDDAEDSQDMSCQAPRKGKEDAVVVASFAKHLSDNNVVGELSYKLIQRLINLL